MSGNFHFPSKRRIGSPRGDLMQNAIFVLTEVFSSKAPPDRAAIQQAVALWLTKELSKPHE